MDPSSVNARMLLHTLPCLQSATRSIEALLQAISEPGAICIDLKPPALTLGRHHQALGRPECLVLRAWPSGCTIVSGELTLPPLALLLLTGSGATFKRTSFVGVAFASAAMTSTAELNCISPKPLPSFASMPGSRGIPTL